MKHIVDRIIKAAACRAVLSVLCLGAYKNGERNNIQDHRLTYSALQIGTHGAGGVKIGTNRIVFGDSTGKDKIPSGGQPSINYQIIFTDIEDLVGQGRRTDLENAGVTIFLKRVKKVDNDNLLLTFRLRSPKGKLLEFTAPALMLYGNIDSFRQDGFKIFKDCSVLWGNIGVNGDELIITTKDKVEFYHINSFEKLNKTLYIPQYTQNHLHNLDVLPAKDGYIRAAVTGNRQEFYKFDTEGNFVEKLPLPREDYFYITVKEKGLYRSTRFEGLPVSMSWLDEDNGIFRTEYTGNGEDDLGYQHNLVTNNTDERFCGTMPGLICNAHTGDTITGQEDTVVYCIMKKKFCFLVLPFPSENLTANHLSSVAAIKYEKGKPTGFVTFSVGSFTHNSTRFLEFRRVNYNTEFIHEYNGLKIHINFPENYAKVTIDWDKMRHKTVSRDGNKILFLGDTDIHDDVIDHLVLYDKTTDKYMKFGFDHVNREGIQGFNEMFTTGSIRNKYAFDENGDVVVTDEKGNKWIYSRITGACIYSEYYRPVENYRQ